MGDAQWGATFKEYCPGCGTRLDINAAHGSDCPMVHTQIQEQYQQEVSTRITRDEMYFGILEVVRKRSTCKRGKVGALLVQDKRIVAVGYNGAPPGAPHCFEIGCDVEENDHAAGCRRTVHAESNVIALCARVGTSCEGGVLYCTHSPCGACARLIVSAGIVGLHYRTPYRLVQGLDVLREAGVHVVRYEE